jgi:hypothetical protein
VLADYRRTVAATREIVAAAGLTDPAGTGGRFPIGEEPPPLIRILFHLLQEYARHVGHLDVARELSTAAPASERHRRNGPRGVPAFVPADRSALDQANAGRVDIEPATHFLSDPCFPAVVLSGAISAPIPPIPPSSTH